MNNMMTTPQLSKVTLNSTDTPINNIIDRDRLRKVQSAVLNDLKNIIIHSMGPAGSNALILRGTSDADIVSEYSKDGNKIIKSVKYQYPIEMSIKAEIENATRHIEKTVGDGTSSVVVMASYVFDSIVSGFENGDIITNPFETIRLLKRCVAMISDKIRERKRECTLEDIYKIALIYIILIILFYYLVLVHLL